MKPTIVVALVGLGTGLISPQVSLPCGPRIPLGVMERGARAFEVRVSLSFVGLWLYGSSKTRHCKIHGKGKWGHPPTLSKTP